LAIAVAVLTVAVRAQYFSDIPRYVDEINEITPAFGIVRGTSPDYSPAIATRFRAQASTLLPIPSRHTADLEIT
jgi:hypothetical protein